MKFILFTVLFALASLSVQSEIIKDIRIVNQLGESYGISSVAAFTSFQIGEQVPDREIILSSIAVDVNRMRESGRYSYVNARMDVEDDSVILVYTVVAKHRLRSITVSGADKMSNRKVRKKLDLQIGQFSDDSSFERASINIKEAYRDFWYPDTKISWESKTNPDLGVVDVTYRIDEGKKLAISKIEFIGNDLIEDKKLRKVMQQKQKSWFAPWSWITGSGKYKEEVVDSDVFSIKSLYMNNGFLDVQISDPVLDDSASKDAQLILEINEGQRYRIGKVSISGMEEVSEEDLLSSLRLRRGEIAAIDNVDRGSESIRAHYGNRGYIRTNIRPAYDADAATGVVDVRYGITEGAIGYIEKINITGNERTKDKVIRRELVMYPSQQYNRSRVKTSENRLRNLNYFGTVSINPVSTGESGKYDLNVQVKEKPTGQFSAGVGFSSVDSLVGYTELSYGNFNWKNWPPVGAGQKFKIRLQLGTERNDVDISFVEPWFLDRKLSFGVDLYHREARYFSDAYDQKNDGMRISLGKPLSRFTRGNFAYTLEQFNVFDVEDSASQAIKDEEGKRLKSGLEYTWTFDSRDRVFNANRGNKTTISPQVAGGPLGAETDIYGVKIRSTQHWPLIGNMILNFRAQLEAVEAFGDSKENAGTYGDGVPIFDRIFLGGSYSLRGFEYRDIGPTDPVTGDPVGGNSSASATVELTYPIWNKIRGAVFYDWGFVNVDSWDFDPAMYADDWGLGIRLDLPGFPLHLDYAWPMTYDERYLEGKGRFNFLIGHTF